MRAFRLHDAVGKRGKRSAVVPCSGNQDNEDKGAEGFFHGGYSRGEWFQAA